MQPATFGKRVLVEISHAIERFALAADPDDPLVVVAMFQRLSYFERETDVYRDIAARADVTLVGIVEDLPPDLPPGVRHVLLDEGEELAREWSVTVLGPRGGATLVAVDQETVDAAAHTLEEGRRFRGHWSFRRADAYREVVRLRSQLPLSDDTRQRMDAVLEAVLETPEPADQSWWDGPLRFLADRVEHGLRERDSVQARLDDAIGHLDEVAERDPRTGLFTPAFLQRWTAGLGPGLAVGLVLLRVPGLAQVRGRYGMRAEQALLTGITGAVTGLLTRTDRVVQMSREDVLVVLPSWPAGHVHVLCDEICGRVGRLDQQYPFVPLPAVGAALVTRERPLPVGRLVAQVEGRGRVVEMAGG
jgi:DICT domain-containing protein/GGDEF domain-containing protein